MGRQRALALDDTVPATRHWEVFHEMLTAERNASANTIDAYRHDLKDAADAVRALGDLADASVDTVVSTFVLAWLLAEVMDQAAMKSAYAIWLELHDRLSTLSSNAVEAIAQYSGHYIYETQPDLVVAAIRAIVQALRDRAPLPTGASRRKSATWQPSWTGLVRRPPSTTTGCCGRKPSCKTY